MSVQSGGARRRVARRAREEACPAIGARDRESEPYAKTNPEPTHRPRFKSKKPGTSYGPFVLDEIEKWIVNCPNCVVLSRKQKQRWWATGLSGARDASIGSYYREAPSRCEDFGLVFGRLLRASPRWESSALRGGRFSGRPNRGKSASSHRTPPFRPTSSGFTTPSFCRRPSASRSSFSPCSPSSSSASTSARIRSPRS